MPGAASLSTKERSAADGERTRKHPARDEHDQKSDQHAMMPERKTYGPSACPTSPAPWDEDVGGGIKAHPAASGSSQNASVGNSRQSGKCAPLST